MLELYIYRFKCKTIDDTVKKLTHIPLLATSTDLKRSLYAVLENEDDDKIEIRSSLKNINAMKSLLNQLKSSYKGGCEITIESERDLEDEFKKFNLKPDSIDNR